jgi:TolA-binding protein
MHAMRIQLIILAGLAQAVCAIEPDGMRKGQAALASGLWEVAAHHFESCASNPEVPAATRTEAGLRLAESLIREQRTGEALAWLDQPIVAAHPEATFWKGIAMASAARTREAIDVLLPVIGETGHPHRCEAAMTVANLQLALGDADGALATLERFATDADPADARRASLHRLELLTDLRRIDEAQALMQSLANEPEISPSMLAWIDGRLLVARGSPTEAIERLKPLLESGARLPASAQDRAASDLAEAMIAANQSQEACGFLVDWIGKHPRSTELSHWFSQLARALPDSPQPNDPTIEALDRWSQPEPTTTPSLIGADDGSASAAWPRKPMDDAVAGYARLCRANLLLRSASANARTQARNLLRRIWLESSGTPWSTEALGELANVHLRSGEWEQALRLLAILRNTTPNADTQAEAAFLTGHAAFSKGDFAIAKSSFEQAAALMSGQRARAATLNAAMAALLQTPGSATDGNDDPAIVSDLMLERARSFNEPTARREALDAFMRQYPDHPRTTEAKLAAAEAALVGPQRDIAYARSQLDAITPESADTVAPMARVELMRLQVEHLSGNDESAIRDARAFIERHPQDQGAAEAMMILGQALFRRGDYNDARLTLEKLALGDASSPRVQTAWLLAARAAALVPTKSSRLEALGLFDKALAVTGPLTAVAKLEKARLMIDLDQLAAAESFLREWFDSLDAQDPMHVAAGLLLAEAIYARGSSREASLDDALAIHDALLPQARTRPALLHRIQYLRGRTLEQMPDPQQVGAKRERDALVAYHSVLETETPPTEWHYFELCGFRALALLEKAGRWQAAVECARRIASFQGPRATEAADRASQLELEHMIWED